LHWTMLAHRQEQIDPPRRGEVDHMAQPSR
jgi:hypothetical protein